MLIVFTIIALLGAIHHALKEKNISCPRCNSKEYTVRTNDIHIYKKCVYCNKRFDIHKK